MLRVFEISRMTNRNGPGIRTLVHFKGCPLRCIWCSTPESQRSEPELLLRASRCIGDGACAEVCPEGAIAIYAAASGECTAVSTQDTGSATDRGAGICIDRNRCAECFRCTKVCHSLALTRSGREWTEEELLREILKDEVFFRTSGGGVTFSGGEPLLHMSDEMVRLYRDTKERGVSIGVDTTGFVPWEHIEAVLPYTDFFLWDLKHMDSEAHERLTGVPNERILGNLRRVDELSKKYGTDIYIRCVQIPGMTDSKENLRKTCEFVRGLRSVRTLDLVAFHHLGKKRYEAVGRPYPMEGTEPPEMDVLLERQRLVESCGIACRISR